QKSTDGGNTWKNVTVGNGANTSSYSFTTAGTDNGAKFHCVVTNSCVGGSATSNPASLTVCVAASITTNPTDQSVISGQTATFTAAASGGTGLYYQWQQSTDGGTTFNDIG